MGATIDIVEIYPAFTLYLIPCEYTGGESDDRSDQEA